MRAIWTLVPAVLAAFAALAQAQPPYAFHGLHTDLIFSEAVALAEKLGGKCAIAARTQDGETSAQCEYVQCSAKIPAGDCEAQGAEAAAGLTIAAQPILRIGLEAPGAAARLTHIVFIFEGSHDIVAAYLEQTFGVPNGETPRSDAESWSHSHRLRWTQGIYLLGLWDAPNLIILGADRTQE